MGVQAELEIIGVSHISLYVSLNVDFGRDLHEGLDVHCIRNSLPVPLLS